MSARRDMAAVQPLPRSRTPLLGRTREREMARDFLRRDDVGLLTLTGPGGSGKTRLALDVAAGLEREFPDGVVFVPLAALSDGEQVLPTIAQAMGIRDVSGQSTADLLARVLADRSLLLLLDNFEHVMSAAPAVADLLARCPSVKVLTTTRAALHVSGERELPVPPLAAAPDNHGEPAGEMDGDAELSHWRDYAAVDPHFALSRSNGTAVATICRRLDGLPLAIELAAARIKAFPPYALLSRLENRLSVLTTGARDAPPGSAPSETPSPGVTTSSPRRNKRCSAVSPSSPAASRWRRRRR